MDRNAATWKVYLTRSKIAIGDQWSWLKHDCLKRERNLSSFNDQ